MRLNEENTILNVAMWESILLLSFIVQTTIVVLVSQQINVKIVSFSSVGGLIPDCSETILCQIENYCSPEFVSRFTWVVSIDG